MVRASAVRLALLALLGLLAEVPLVEEAVQQEGHRDVEAEHQDRDHRDDPRLLAKDCEQSGEEDRGDAALLQGTRPTRSLRRPIAGLPLLLAAAAGP